LGEVFDSVHLKLQTHLDNLIDRLRIAGSCPGGRTAAKFCTIFDLLRGWHWQHKDHGSGPKEGVTDSAPSSTTLSPEATNRQQQVWPDIHSRCDDFPFLFFFFLFPSFPFWLSSFRLLSLSTFA
jgi:hypothetical protein